MLALVDCNNFFVSCERVFQPWLRGRPVGVLSNNDGCVIARSPELKALGIAMGTPYFQLRPLIPLHGLILKSSNYALYGDFSRRVMQILQEFSATLEPYSVDEAFMSWPATVGEAWHELGQRLRATLLQWLGLPVSVGFANNRTLAKVANHLAKKLPSGVFVMPDDPTPWLDRLPVAEVWGIGSRTAARLQRLGIVTAAQLAASSETLLQKRLGVGVARTALELRGQSVLTDEDPDASPQSVTCSRSFGKPVQTLAEMAESVASYAAAAAEKMRRHEVVAAGCHVFFVHFAEDGSGGKRIAPEQVASAMVMFAQPTHHTADILAAVARSLPGLFQPGRRYKKSGVVMFGLEPAVSRQPSLFPSQPAEERAGRLDAVVDQINRSFGRRTLFSLSEGIGGEWRMKRTMLSPNYTGDWRDLPVAQA